MPPNRAARVAAPGGHPLSRLIAVADRYDLYTQRPPRGPGILPDAALRQLLVTDDVDRAAARLLISTIGLFPVGSTVKLTNGYTAIVVDVPDPAHATEPLVMIVENDQGQATERKIYNLAATGLGIAGTVDAVEMDLNVGFFVFA